VRPGERIARVNDRATDLLAEIDYTVLAAHCKSEESRKDAFLILERLDNSSFGPDPALALARMYLAFAERHRLRVTVLDERQSEGSLRQVVLFIEGLCPYGVLRHEHGIHRLISEEETSRRHRERVTAFCHVELLAEISDAELRLARNDVLVSNEGMSASSLLEVRQKHAVRVAHRPTNTLVCVRADASQESVLELAHGLLRARLGARTGERSDAATTSTPVRSYRFGAVPSVKDEATGERSAKLGDVLEGRIEPFLAARAAWERSREELARLGNGRA